MTNRKEIDESTADPLSMKENNVYHYIKRLK